MACYANTRQHETATPSGALELAGHAQGWGIDREVDVRPLQPEHLALTHVDMDSEDVQRLQPVSWLRAAPRAI